MYFLHHDPVFLVRLSFCFSIIATGFMVDKGEYIFQLGQAQTPALLAFVVLGFVSLIPSQESGWEVRHRNDRFCVEWD